MRNLFAIKNDSEEKNDKSPLAQRTEQNEATRQVGDLKKEKRERMPADGGVG